MEPIKTDSEKCEINVRLSYMQIKYLMLKWKQLQTVSTEGQILQQMAKGLRQYLIRKAKAGDMPKEIIDEYMSEVDKQNAPPEDPKKYIDKTTILIKPNQGPENE